MKHGFIGFGNLANAVYRGLKEEKGLEFAFTDKEKKDVELLSFDKIESLVSYADIVWLTVKPQDLAGILVQMRNIDINGKTIVSPVAGKSIAFIEQYLGEKTTIVRIMPNLAMTYKASVTAFCTNHPDNKKADKVYNLLCKLGKAVKLQESGFDLFTSVFGSGPAFILAVIKSFKNKTEEFGLPETVTDELLIELVRGTTLYFNNNKNDYSIDELISNITSKGGTTQAGLEYFYSNNIGKLLEGVLDAARIRSEKLSQN